MYYLVSEAPIQVKTLIKIKNVAPLLLVVILCGCPPPEIDLPGDISGSVQDADTEESVEDAEVKLFQTNDLIETDTTGIDGTFLFSKLEPSEYSSEYSIEVIKDGYDKHTEEIDVFSATTWELEILLRARPELKLSTSWLHFGFESTQMSFSISNSGKGTLNYEIIPTQNWIKISQESGEITENPDLIEVTIQRSGLQEKSHLAWITIHSDILDETQIDSIDVYVNYVMDEDSILYRTVRIGTQVWMAENLNTGIKVEAHGNIPTSENGIIEKICYDNDSLNCKVYGGLYKWDEMMDYKPSDDAIIGTTQGICPAGWHVPTDKEWLTLETFLGGPAFAGEKMKDSTLWQAGITSVTNESGFSALPGGVFIPQIQDYYSIRESTLFWSSYKESRNIWYIKIENDRTSLFSGFAAADWNQGAMSVRCVMDSP